MRDTAAYRTGTDLARAYVTLVKAFAHLVRNGEPVHSHRILLSARKAVANDLMAHYGADNANTMLSAVVVSAIGAAGCESLALTAMGEQR